jgi:hypothetical protein
MTPDKQTKVGWRREDWCNDFGCRPTYSRKLEKEGVIKTLQLGPKMTIITTSPAEALATLAQRAEAA